jgi:hypothetical protein
MDSAVAVSAVLIFLILQYPDDGNIGATNVALWWGNAVYTNTADYNAVPVRPFNVSKRQSVAEISGFQMLTPPPNGTFGPATW